MRSVQRNASRRGDTRRGLSGGCHGERERSASTGLDRVRSGERTAADEGHEARAARRVGQLVYGRVTKLVQFGAFVQVGDGIEGLVHISEMSAHHVDSPEQVVTPGEELWVKIIDLDLARRRISLSIKQAAEGGELAAEYREHFEVDAEGNYVQGEANAEAEAAWTEYYGDGSEAPAEGGAPAAEGEAAAVEGEAPAAEAPVAEAVTEEAAPVAEEAAAEEVAPAAE